MRILKVGFTLAEVLVTLAVIGVIASMTIPALMNNIDNQNIKALWKKSYAEISQAVSLLARDNGGSLKNLCDVGDNNCFESKLISNFKSIKECTNGQSNDKCWSGANYFINTASFILSNGVYVHPEWSSPGCNHASWHGAIPKCAMIWVDVNGLKIPNTIGKDIFAIQVLENGVKPLGTINDGYENTCNPAYGTESGSGCSAKYLYE